MKRLLTALLLLTTLAFQIDCVSAEPTSAMTASTEVSEKLDLNSATVEQLQALPGIGKSKASAIVTYRENVGPFLEVEQLTEVKGIGRTILENLTPFVTVR